MAPQQIEHQPTKPKYQSRIARFWARRSYSFKAATYGFVGGGVPLLALAAVETCLPGAGLLAKTATFAANALGYTITPLTIYMAIREARKLRPQLSEALAQRYQQGVFRRYHPDVSKGIGEEDASEITWKTAIGVGIPNWYIGFFPPSMAYVCHKMLAPAFKYGFGPVEIGIAALFTAFCTFAAPMGAKIIKTMTEEHLRNKFQIFRLPVISGDEKIGHQPAHPRDRAGNEPRLSPPRDKPFRME